jgi:hypothetical protein
MGKMGIIYTEQDLWDFIDFYGSMSTNDIMKCGGFKEQSMNINNDQHNEQTRKNIVEMYNEQKNEKI